MLEKIKNWVILNKIRTGLLIFNLALFVLAVIFFHLGMLPISKTGDLIFWLILIFALALYRPGWAFLFFSGAMVLENISLTSPAIGLTLRIYQALGALIIAAVIIRLALKKSGLSKFSLEKPDYLVLALFGGSLLSSLFSAEKGASLKITLVIFSFTALYFLVRIYVQDRIDLKKVIPFFLTTSLGVVLYGILQNIFFIQGFSFHGEVMPGRPNATFTEPDWLGIYLVFLLAVVYALIYYFSKVVNNSLTPILNFKFFPLQRDPAKTVVIFNRFSINKFKIFKTFLYLFLIPIYILLIITVSRSAWLGAGFITLVFLKAVLTDFSWHLKNWQWKMFLHQAVFVACSGAVSLLIMYSFNLTNFQLWSRAASASGLQKITISCENIPQKNCLLVPIKDTLRVENIEELEKYCCRHINLEDIKKETSIGNFVTEAYRPDPNVNIRGQIFQKSWEAIKKHPILGIGYGAIAPYLGQDERGVSLNSSNIFLEVWLGSGLIGLLAFVLIWLNAIMVFVKRFWSGYNEEEKALALFVLLGIFAFLIPNLFNAGIFLMIMWFFWGIIPIKFKEKNK
jgi:hypothetical protein